MDRSFLIQLTNDLYKLTLLFPKKEPLRYKIRELADSILASLVNQHPRLINSVLETLEILDSYFEVAKAQNWVSPSEILAIQKEYANLREELKKVEPEKKQEEAKENEPNQIEAGPLQVLFPEERNGINERQEKILAFLRENGRVQVWQVKQILPEVSKRTLRRDFEYMLNQGIVERMGERNNTYYTRARQSRAKGGEEDSSSSTQIKISKA